MKKLQQIVTCVRMTDEPLEIIKEMYQSESKKTGEEFVRMLIHNGHESALEHASLSVKVQMDRGIAHFSEVGITANFAAWRNFLKLRLSSKAHPMIRTVARAIWVLLPPVVVEDICFGCGCKPYMWSNNPPAIHRDGYMVWKASDGGTPKKRYFPLCECER